MIKRYAAPVILPAYVRYAEGSTTFEIEIPHSPIVVGNLKAAVPDLDRCWSGERGVFSFGMDYFARIKRILLSYYSLVYLETTMQDGEVVTIPLHTNKQERE